MKTDVGRAYGYRKTSYFKGQPLTPAVVLKLGTPKAHDATQNAPFAENFPLLSSYSQTKDATTLDRIIRTKLRLVQDIAFRYQRISGRRLPFEDLISEAVLGPIKAIERFERSVAPSFFLPKLRGGADKALHGLFSVKDHR